MMKAENIQSLEKLSVLCHFAGFICIFLGIVVISIEVMTRGMGHIQAGLFILVIGYAWVKISSKLSDILMSEKSEKR